MTVGGAAPRAPDIDPDDLSPAQARVWQAITDGPRGAVVGPLRVWLHSPEMAERAQALGQYARYDSALPPRLSELAILVTARVWSSGFEWAHHAPIAAREGLPQEAIDAIAEGRRPALPDAAAAAVFDLAAELHRDRDVGEATFARARAALGMAGVVDLIAICGYYTLISMTINAFRVPDGAGPALPSIPGPVADLFRTA